jgi:hypothetical protein
MELVNVAVVVAVVTFPPLVAAWSAMWAFSHLR